MSLSSEYHAIEVLLISCSALGPVWEKMDHLVEPSQLSRERGPPPEGPEVGEVTVSLWALS